MTTNINNEIQILFFFGLCNFYPRECDGRCQVKQCQMLGWLKVSLFNASYCSSIKKMKSKLYFETFFYEVFSRNSRIDISFFQNSKLTWKIRILFKTSIEWRVKAQHVYVSGANNRQLSVLNLRHLSSVYFDFLLFSLFFFFSLPKSNIP